VLQAERSPEKSLPIVTVAHDLMLDLGKLDSELDRRLYLPRRRLRIIKDIGDRLLKFGEQGVLGPSLYWFFCHKSS
jgi:hypothetical protein